MTESKPFLFPDLDYSQLEPDMSSEACARRKEDRNKGVSSGRVSCQEPSTYYMDKHGNFVRETPQERATLNRWVRQYRAGHVLSHEHNAFVLVPAYIPGICRAVSSCCCCGKTIRANSTGGSHYVCLDCAEWIPGAKQRFDELQHRMESL